jgi:hypothetical protein
MGVIGLEVESGTASAQDLAEVCGWPSWSFGPSVLTVDPDWTAVFNRKERSLRAIIHFGEDNQVDLVLFQARTAVPIPPSTWAALEQAGSVLLCGIVQGGPSTANLQAATAAGELHAVVAEAHFGGPEM